MITHTFSYQFKKPISKVHYFLPAFQNSLVIVYQVSLGKDGIMHINNKKQIVYSYAFQGLVDTLGMLSETQAIVLLVQKNKIFILNLLTRTFKLYNHQYKVQQSCQVKLQTFYSTKLICIRQNGAYNQHILKLTYYEYPLKQESAKCRPIAEFDSQEGDWTYQYTIRKGNSHSMIIWFKSRHDDQFQMKVFDLKDDKRGKYRILKIKNTLGQPYGLEKINCCIQDIWEMSKNVFCLVGVSDKSQKRCFNSKGNIINTFIWEAEQQTIREARIQFDPKYNNFQIDCMSFGEYSMFRTFYFEHNIGPVESPVKYIKNSTQEVYQTENWKCSYISKWSFPGYYDNLIVEGQFDNAGVYSIKIIIRIFVPRKIASYHLLAQSKYKCFDQNLLSQIISCLDYDQ